MPRTLDSYTRNLNRHVLPAFGRFKLRELHRGHIRDFLTGKRAAGLGKQSVRLIRAVLSVLLSDAVDDGILVANPALQLRGSRRRRPDSISHAERQKKIRPMSHSQLACFKAWQRPETPWELALEVTERDSADAILGLDAT